MNRIALYMNFMMFGYLLNAVVRRVSLDPWPADTKYPLIGLGLVGVSLVLGLVLHRDRP